MTETKSGLSTLMIFLDLVMNRVHENERINSVQRTVLPCGYFGHYLLNYFAHQTVRNIHVIQIFIENQKLILRKYAEEHGLFNCKFYVDNGYSGASTERQQVFTNLRKHDYYPLHI